MKYQGSCHCGNIRFEAEGSIEGAMACNCSICSRKGVLMWFIPREQLKLLTPDDNAATYLFNTHRIRHRFCTTCGIHPYADALNGKDELMAAINIRTIEGLDVGAIPVTHYDGRNLR